MTTPERYAAKVSEMQRTLEYRFAGWGLKDADVKAAELVQELLRAGWKPWAPVVALPPRPDVVHLPPTDLIAEWWRRAAQPWSTRHTEPEEQP